MIIPGIDLSEVVDGQSLQDWWHYHTVNVKYLGTLTHEQFYKEHPVVTEKLAQACLVLEKLDKLVKE